MRTVLVVEDDDGIVESLKKMLVAKIKDVDFQFEQDFDKAPAKIREIDPDVVVLDLQKDGADSNAPGELSWKGIWEDMFCSVIVYTGHDAVLDPPLPENHPFVFLINKGPKSIGELRKKLQEIFPLLDEAKRVRSRVDSTVREVMRDMFGASDASIVQPSTFEHSLRRRVAAAMDHLAEGGDGEHPPAWSMYLVPSFGTDPLTSDLLRIRGAEVSDPSSYRLVLSPSCDLARGGRVPEILVARCETIDRLCQVLKIKKATEPGEASERLRREVLTQGCLRELLPLPGFPGRFPNLVFNFKKLELIPYDAVVEIGGTSEAERSYERVASIDSPFREQIVWGFINTGARPGMPDRDLGPWAEELFGAYANQR